MELTSEPKPSNTVTEFWKWFQENENHFREIYKDPTEGLSFIEDIMEQLKPVNPWLKAMAGQYGDDTFELVITTDGDIAFFSKAYELINAAPPITGWVFNALKPAMGFENIRINMYGREFSGNTVQFYPILDEAHPDEVTIMLTHQDYNEEDDEQFQTGGMILLENGLGELATATKIDGFETGPVPQGGAGDLIPLTKLPDYLNWREKEFVEKYELQGGALPEESFSYMEAKDTEGRPMMAVMNQAYVDWDFKPAYPWLVIVELTFQSANNGLPNEQQLQEIEQIEEELLKLLPEKRMIHLGHRIYDNTWRIFNYANDFMNVSRIILDYIDKNTSPYTIVLDIEKDKYWQTIEQFFEEPQL